MERHLPPVVQGDCGKQCGKQAIMPPREGGMRDSELRAGGKTQRARRDSWCSLANTTTWTTESARICEMKSITLPSTHYAAQWKTEGMIKSLPEINDLGRRYAELPAEMAGISNPAKQDLLLELCQCFHLYLMKYLVMICRGHVPISGIGPKSQFGNVNSDVKEFPLLLSAQGPDPDAAELESGGASSAPGVQGYGHRGSLRCTDGADGAPSISTILCTPRR